MSYGDPQHVRFYSGGYVFTGCRGTICAPVGTLRGCGAAASDAPFLLGGQARLEYADVSSQRVQLAKEIRRALAAQHVVTAEATA
jgi:hypothetical protein